MYPMPHEIRTLPARSAQQQMPAALPLQPGHILIIQQRQQIIERLQREAEDLARRAQEAERLAEMAQEALTFFLVREYGGAGGLNLQQMAAEQEGWQIDLPGGRLVRVSMRPQQEEQAEQAATEAADGPRP